MPSFPRTVFDSSTVGTAQVARATPDGHTLLMTHQGVAAINPHLFASPG